MKKLLVTLCLVSFVFVPVLAQKEATKEVKIRLKDGKQPTIIIDGKKYDYAILELLDQSKIKAMNVVKGEKATEEYNAPNGVIIISTKSSEAFEGETKFKVRGPMSEKDPMFIIDGIKSSKKELKNLEPDGIASIDVIKGEKAMKEYNAPNGVIVVTTKKKD